MSLRSLKFAVFVLISASACAAGQGVQTDQQAYCAYLTEQARAQSDLLRTPSALGAFTQPDTGLPQQLVAGAQLSLSNLKKAGITDDAAQELRALHGDNQHSAESAIRSAED